MAGQPVLEPGRGSKSISRVLSCQCKRQGSLALRWVKFLGNLNEVPTVMELFLCVQEGLWEITGLQLDLEWPCSPEWGMMHDLLIVKIIYIPGAWMQNQGSYYKLIFRKLKKFGILYTYVAWNSDLLHSLESNKLQPSGYEGKLFNQWKVKSMPPSRWEQGNGQVRFHQWKSSFRKYGCSYLNY